MKGFNVVHEVKNCSELYEFMRKDGHYGLSDAALDLVKTILSNEEWKRQIDNNRSDTPSRGVAWSREGINKRFKEMGPKEIKKKYGFLPEVKERYGGNGDECLNCTAVYHLGLDDYLVDVKAMEDVYKTKETE